MPPIVKDTGVPGSPVIAKNDKSTLLQMPAAYRPGAETAGRVQPVALEVPVSVNGARTLDGTGTREPFSETSKTVLVLGNGAVIRLNAPVAPGQLLFLTNLKTKREVVCQVVKSKTYRNVSGYVEIEFTEPSVGFWGVRFPTDRIGPLKESTPIVSTVPAASSLASLPSEPKPEPPSAILQKPPVSAPPAVEPPAGDFSFDSFPFAPPTVAPKIPAVHKTAVPAIPVPEQPGKSLDELLAELTATLPVSAKPTTQPKTTAAPELDAAALQEQISSFLFAEDQNSTKSSEAKASEELSTKPPVITSRRETFPAAELPKVILEPKIENTPQPSASHLAAAQSEEIEMPTWLMPKAPPSQVVHRSPELPLKVEPAVVAQAVETISESSLEIQDSATSPFGSTLTGEISGRNSQSATSSRNGLWIGVAATVLALSAGGYWYFQQPASKTVAASNAPVSIPKAATPLSSGSATSSRALATAAATEADRLKADTAAPSSSSSAKNPPAPGLAADAAVSAVPPPVSQPKMASFGKLRLAAPLHAKVSSQDTVAAPAFDQSMPSTASMGASFAGASGQPAAPAAIGGNVTAAKLLSSVQPAYNGLAKSQHVSGDVKMDALIDANGRVTAVKVLSGPVLLQQSAKDAVRQWKYQPAMLNGNPVSMHLTITLQFRLQ